MIGLVAWAVGVALGCVIAIGLLGPVIRARITGRGITQADAEGMAWSAAGVVMGVVIIGLLAWGTR